MIQFFHDYAQNADCASRMFKSAASNVYRMRCSTSSRTQQPRMDSLLCWDLLLPLLSAQPVNLCIHGQTQRSNTNLTVQATRHQLMVSARFRKAPSHAAVVPNAELRVNLLGSFLLKNDSDSRSKTKQNCCHFSTTDCPISIKVS